MGMTVWLNVRTGDRHESDAQDLSALFDLQEQLNELADSLGVTSPADYFDDTDVRYNSGEDDSLEESDDGWPASAARWYDPADILASSQKLLSHLRSTPNAVRPQDGWTQSQLIEDFESLIPALEQAKSAGKQVHLLIVM